MSGTVLNALYKLVSSSKNLLRKVLPVSIVQRSKRERGAAELLPNALQQEYREPRDKGELEDDIENHPGATKETQGGSTNGVWG